MESVTITFHHTEPSTLPLETNTVKKVAQRLIFMHGESKEDQGENIAKKIIESFKSRYNDTEQQ